MWHTEISKEDSSEKVNRAMRTGIYFNPSTNEVTSVTDADVPPRSQWQHVSDDSRLGLLAIRELVLERGLADDPTTVYWYLPQPAEAVKPLPGCDAPARPTNAGPLARLRAALPGAGRPPVAVR